MLFALVACSPPHVGPVQYNPLPAALALWKDFPAGQDPRPIVWLGNASPVNGFSTPEAWESAACGSFTLNAHFPTDYSTYSLFHRSYSLLCQTQFFRLFQSLGKICTGFFTLLENDI